MNVQYGSFTAEDIISTLILVKQNLPRGYKWSLFMDNASIHTKRIVPEWCEKNDVPITWNATYRPDLMGIEFFWREAKQKYRKELTELYVEGRHIDNLKLTKNVCWGVTDEKAKKWALLGWQNLYNAELIPATP